MTDPQPILAEDPPLTDASAARAVRHMGMLAELAEIGMALARTLSGSDGVKGDAGLAFSRLSRSIRQTIALEARIDADEHARAAGIVVEAAEAWEAREDRIEGVVTRIIRAEAADDSHAERLLDEMCEHLEDEDVYDDYSHRPTGEIIALICKDLGLAPDWGCWEGRDWAADAARTMTSGAGRPLSQPPDGACQLPRFTGEQGVSSPAPRSGGGVTPRDARRDGGGVARRPP
jgi:hypothetical protein